MNILDQEIEGLHMGPKKQNVDFFKEPLRF
jgi:hypothetical protein